MRTNTSTGMRGAVALFATALLVCGGVAAADAAETPFGDDDVDISVAIPEIDEPGILALTVAADSTSLTENGSDPLQYRQFTGTLPAVTVTDTRTADEVPAGAYWYVLGSAGDFVATGLSPVDGANLGWSPALVGDDAEGVVFAGEPVAGALDGAGPGVVAQDLLFSTADSAAVSAGAWTANADLRLRTPVNVAPGDYASVFTLSLFENTQ